MRTRRHFLRLGLVIGVLLTCAPVFAVLGTMLGMTQAYQTMGSSGIGDPRQLATAVAGTLLATAGGFALFPRASFC